MARFRIGDRVKVNVTVGSIYDKCGTIIGYAQTQYFVSGQCYPAPRWRVLLDNDECISIDEKYLNAREEW